MKHLIQLLFIVIALAIPTQITIGTLYSKNEKLKDEKRFVAFVQSSCQELPVDKNLVYSMMYVESKCKVDAVNRDSSCFGLMQLSLPTAQWILHDSTVTAQRLLTDRYLNARAGILYVRYLSKRFQFDIGLVLTAYNRGPGKVTKMLRAGIDPSNGYKDLVNARLQKIRNSKAQRWKTN